MTAVVIGLWSNGLCLHLKSLFPFFICFFPLQIFQISTPLKKQCRCSPFLFLCVFVEYDILLKQRQLPRCPFHLSGPHWFIVHFRFHSENAGFLSLILFGNLWIMKVAGCSSFSLFDILLICLVSFSLLCYLEVRALNLSCHFHHLPLGWVEWPNQFRKLVDFYI